MTFKGFRADVADGISAWNLSAGTLRALYLSLMPLVEKGLDASKPDPNGIWFAAAFDDPERKGHCYYVNLKLTADIPEEFYARYIHLVRYDAKDHLVWDRECPKRRQPPAIPV